mgnify:CR=1 FL=1
MKAFKIILSNRTKEKAMNLKNIFDNLTVAEWGELPDFDMIINATSIGLKEGDKFSLDFKNKGEIYKAELIESIPQGEEVSIYFHGKISMIILTCQIN